MYSLTTNSIKVSVTPNYLDNKALIDEGQYGWAYQINIENKGMQIVQLINRHWIITDAQGLTKEVQGPGVVGEQPILKPGESFEYTSGVTLNTPSGIMVGTYEMDLLDSLGNNLNQNFKIDIPAFSLDTPEQLSMPN